MVYLWVLITHHGVLLGADNPPWCMRGVYIPTVVHERRVYAYRCTSGCNLPTGVPQGVTYPPWCTSGWGIPTVVHIWVRNTHRSYLRVWITPVHTSGCG